MRDFKRGKFPILVSTDVAARGIDVDDVEAVINFDLPNEDEYYLHRIGRTGRAHKHGVSFSLVTFQESVRMEAILKYMIAQPVALHFEDGVLRYPCFHDKSASYLEVHPKTGVTIRGFEIPLYKEAVDLCLEAALVEPRVGYVGWDVAITPDGPALVEGNLIPGYDMPQNAVFHPDGCGMLPAFEKALGFPIPR
jgi:hypothetical protein